MGNEQIDCTLNVLLPWRQQSRLYINKCGSQRLLVFSEPVVDLFLSGHKDDLDTGKLFSILRKI